ncbi:MAG: hypothetical protein Q8O67_24290 [Deltaproteobacteria bacterium]|nr:hypothetical protein [Deltaproteobacteria bacterium]
MIALVVLCLAAAPPLLSSDSVSASPASTAALPAGTYRLEVRVVAVTELPLLGAQQSITTTLSHAVVDDQGAITATACAINTRAPGFSTRMPPSSIRSMPPAHFTFVRGSGDTWQGDMGVGRLGFRGNGALPENADDPRVRDDDGDGEPGLRVELLGPLGTHVIQVVAQGHTVLLASVDVDGAQGRLQIRSQERVLSGLPMGPTGPSVIDTDHSRFRLSPVNAASCKDLR